MNRLPRVGAWALALALLAPASIRAQDETADDPDALRSRVKALEARQRELEKKLEGSAPAPAKAAPAKAAPEEAPAAVEKDATGVGVKLDPGAPEGTIKLELPHVKKLTIGGKLRIRDEWRDPRDYRVPGTFGRAATDSKRKGTSFTLLRTRLAFDFEVSDPLRAFVELSDSRRFGDEDANASLDPDIATVNLYQGFLELALKPLVEVPIKVRAGRFEVLSLGDARLVSSLDWSNVGRSWDGVQVLYESEKLWATVFATTPREGAVFAANNDGERDFYFTGVYASVRAIEKHELDGYFFARLLGDRKAFTSERGRTGKREDFTTGVRLKGGVAGLDYTGELVYQFGHVARDPIDAWAAAVTLGYTLELDEDVKARLGGEYAYASGDSNATDGKIHTFDPLLPFGHSFHGHMDLMGFMNMHGAMVSSMFQPLKDLELHCDGHSFWLAQSKDAWYDAGKNRIRRDTTGKARSHVGFELDGYVKAKVLGRLWIWAGYSHFFPGTYPHHTGFAGDQDWAFGQVEAKF